MKSLGTPGIVISDLLYGFFSNFFNFTKNHGLILDYFQNGIGLFVRYSKLTILNCCYFENNAKLSVRFYNIGKRLKMFTYTKSGHNTLFITKAILGIIIFL